MRPFDVNETQEILDRLERNRAARPRRLIFGVHISNDFGKTWKLAALCDPCRKAIEPPTMVKNLGAAGTQGCDWCNAINHK